VAKAWALDDAQALGVTDRLAPLINRAWDVTLTKPGKERIDEVRTAKESVAEQLNGSKGLASRSSFEAGFWAADLEQTSAFACVFWSTPDKVDEGDFWSDQIPEALHEYRANAKQSMCLPTSDLDALEPPDAKVKETRQADMKKLYDSANATVYNVMKTIRPSYVNDNREAAKK
jgi:hypothetical protein